MSQRPHSDRVGVLLITGFLGSGKTTFINWLLKKRPKEKISLILNEFGDVKLESQFVADHNGEVLELANGCMCCVAKSDIPRTVKLILEQSPATQMILVEASGLSDPEPVRASLESPELASLVYVDTVVCIIDTLNFLQTKDEHPIVMSQAADADLLLLSKTSEADEKQIQTIKNLLQTIFDQTTVLEMSGSLHPDLFLNTIKKKAKPKFEKEHSHLHNQYDEIWYRSSFPLNIQKLHQSIASLPKDVIRAKGYVLTLDDQNQQAKVLVQYVAGKYTITPGNWQEGEKLESVILLIGKGLDDQKIKQTFADCEIS